MSERSPTRERILQSAYELFVDSGYHGCSMRDIARSADIQVASIYNHFESKEHIFETVFSSRHPMYRIVSILDNVKGSSAEELVSGSIKKIIEEMSNEPGLLRLFFIELVEMDGKHIPGAINSHFPRGSEFVDRLYSFSVDIRKIRPPVLLRSLISFALSQYMFKLFVEDSDSKKWGSQEEIMDVFLHGVLKS